MVRVSLAMSSGPVDRHTSGLPHERNMDDSSSVASSRRGLRITLWVLQVALALFFIMVGYSHALAPFDQVAKQATWMQDVPRALSLFIGYAELAGGLGLIVPAATRIAASDSWRGPRRKDGRLAADAPLVMIGCAPIRSGGSAS